MKEREKHHYPKHKRVQRCMHCDSIFPVGLARCTSCKQWNVPKPISDKDDQTILLSEVELKPLERLSTGPWDECFGTDSLTKTSGIVTTGVTLLGGAPGAGKSTLSMQLADCIAHTTDREVLYIAAEEDGPEILNRALRIGIKHANKIRVYPMGANTELADILKSRKPCAIIVDSLPGIVPDPEQAVEFCVRFKPYAVDLKAPVIIIDHVTKDHGFAGLMKLQHAVDTLMTLFQISRESELREMSVIKNRFGRANFTKLLFMTEKNGLIDYNESEEENG